MDFHASAEQIKALKNQLEDQSVAVLQAQSRLQNLQEIIQEKESRAEQLEKENGRLKESLFSLEKQKESITATVKHYRDVMG